MVVPFVNLSGDRKNDVLGFLAADRIAHALATSGLEVIPPLASLLDAPTTADPGRSSTDPEDMPGFSLARETGAAHLISGTVHSEGGTLGIQTHLFDVAHRTLRVPRIGEAILTGNPLSAIEPMVGRVTGTLAALLDERLATWATAASQPASFEVYEAFVSAIDSYAAADSAAAQRFRTVAAMDTTFTAPLIWAMLAELLTNRSDAADSVIQVLLPRRRQLPPWERAMLDWGAAFVAGDRPGRTQALARLVKLVPESFWVGLAVADAMDRKSPREALRHLARLGPDRVWYGQPWGNYFRASAAAYHLLGDDQAERDILHEWRGRGDLPPPTPTDEARALAGSRRTADLSRLVHRLLTEERGPLPLSLADELAGHGHDSLSRLVNEQRLSALAGSETGARSEVNAGIARVRSLIRLGRFDEGRALVERLLQSPGDQEGVLRGDLGRIAGLQGDVATARAQMDWFASREMRYSGGWLTAKRAQIAAALGHRGELLQFMSQAEREGWVWGHEQQFSPEYATFQTDQNFLAFFQPRG